jgi:transcriptional regulator with GAF, ATPase, and Fis domain
VVSSGESIIAGSLAILCEQNGARGAVFRFDGGDVALVASSAGLDQAFLDESERLLTGDREQGSLQCFRVPHGAVVLDALQEEQCSPNVRGHILRAIDQALSESGAELSPVSKREQKRRSLLRKLQAVGWNVSELSRREGVTARAVHLRMQRYGVKRPGRA